MKKFYCIVFVWLVCFSIAFLPNCAKVVMAQQSAVNILAFGDSISAGYAPNSAPYNVQQASNADDAKKYQMFCEYANYQNAQYGTCANKFAHSYLMAERLKREYDIKTQSVVSFANSGDSSSDLVDLFTKFQSKTLSNGSTIETTPTEMQTQIAGADIITLCIGANDILAPATQAVSNVLSFSQDDLDNLTATLEQNVANFKTNYENIILPKLNIGAQIYVMTIYNPYKAFTKTAIKQKIESFGEPISLMAETISQNFSTIFETANQYLEQINNIIKNNAKNNVLVVDIASKFNAIVDEEYSLYINANLSKASYADLMNFASGVSTNFDPHPTPQGQESIAESFVEVYKEKNSLGENTEAEQNQIIKIALISIVAVLGVLAIGTLVVTVFKKIRYRKIHF